jgi:hypothetical protein
VETLAVALGPKLCRRGLHQRLAGGRVDLAVSLALNCVGERRYIPTRNIQALVR